MGSFQPGYALLLGAMIAVLALYRFRRRQREPAGRGAPFRPSPAPSARFSDVAANDEAMESLRDVLHFIRSPETYSRFGARVPHGVMLYGAPGTGKTLMARALAGEAGVPFFAVNGADFVEMYVGVGASRVRALFQAARKAGRAVIFFDEIDAIGKKRDNRSDEREQTLNALLSEMSGFGERDGVVVVAATNRLDTLDEALLRAGRFDRQIEVPLPGLAERLRILQVHARGKPLAQDVSLEALARDTALFSGAKLECLLNEAAILAAKRDAQSIESADVQHALDTLLFGMERPGASRLAHEREVTAAHEAGHAILTAVLLPQSEIRKVSIIPTGRGAAGYSMAVPQEKLFHEKRELMHHIAVALAGRRKHWRVQRHRKGCAHRPAYGMRMGHAAPERRGLPLQPAAEGPGSPAVAFAGTAAGRWYAARSSGRMGEAHAPSDGTRKRGRRRGSTLSGSIEKA